MASAPIEILPFESFEGGMNQADAAHEIADNEAQWLQDILVNEPGLTVRRGPVKPDSNVAATFTRRGIGLVAAENPHTDVRYAVLTGDNSNAYINIFSTNYATTTQLAWLTNFSTTKSYILDAKPCLDGGTLIGTSSRYDATDPTNQAIVYWCGASKANYTTGTITTSYGDTLVTGAGTSWLANVEPGMFLFNGAGDKFYGQVKSVDSNTQITLTDKCLQAAAGGNYTLTSIRGLGQRSTTGRVTCTTAAATVTGANTKFKYQGFDNGTWDMFRAVDMKFIGTVQAVTNNTSLTLTGNAQQALDNEQYVAVKRGISFAYDTTSAGLGFITAVYARRQWYANRAAHKETDRVWFSSELDFEAVDTSKQDGDFIRVKAGDSKKHSAPIKAMVSAYNSLLILKGNESFAVFGDNPDSFELRKIADDGALSGMSAQPWEGGVLYAGREAIYFYDGVEVKNISQEKLGNFYKRLVKGFDPETYRMWGVVCRDHYLLHIEHVNSPVNVVRGNSSTTPTRLTLVVYLPTMSWTVWTNVDIRGHINLSSETTLGMWYLVNDNAAHARICSIDDLFDSTGLDTITCEGNSAGPRFHIELGRLGGNEQVRKKLWKQLTAHYKTNGDSLTVNVIPGLDDPGISTSAVLPNTVGKWAAKRVKFLKRAHHLGIRIYETTPVTSTEVVLGPLAIALKRMRPQKV